MPDSWIFNHNKGVYSSRSFYNLHFSQQPDHGPSKWIWKSKCMSKHKFFAWLVLHDRINCKDMMLRRKWKVTEDNDCVLCVSHGLETRNHLFFECLFSSRIWACLQIGWSAGSVSNSMTTAKKHFKGPCFIEIAVLACWNIWKKRNNHIFL